MTALAAGQSVVVAFAAEEAVTVTSSGEATLLYLQGDHAGTQRNQTAGRKQYTHHKPGQVRVTCMSGTCDVLQAGSAIEPVGSTAKPSGQWDPTYVLPAGVIGDETDTGVCKKGDGVTPWASLLYFTTNLASATGSVAVSTSNDKRTTFVDVGPNVTLNHLGSTACTPTAIADSNGVGVGGNVSVDSRSSDRMIYLTVNTANTPANGSGNVANIAFAVPFASAPLVTQIENNANAKMLLGGNGGNVPRVGTVTANGFQLMEPITNGLPTGKQYLFTFLVDGA